MKKYNLSNIMKRAWELVKKAGMTISSGLKKAWEEAKQMCEYNLRGTEKQIAWAIDIIKTIEKVIYNFEDAYADDPRLEPVKPNHQVILNNMKNEYAGNIITDFSRVKVTINPDIETVNEEYRDLFGYVDNALLFHKRNYRIGITK